MVTGPLTRVVSGLVGVRDLDDPAVPHLALDASQPTATLVRSVLDHLSR